MILRLALAAALAGATGVAQAQQERGAALDIEITYIGRDYPQPLPLSLIEERIDQPGIMGARLAQQENELTGRFVGQTYRLAEHVIPMSADFAAEAGSIMVSASPFLVADLDRADLLALAALPGAQDRLILNVRAPDDDLRTNTCFTHVYHIAPSWRMKADGLAQYLAWKRWDDWLLVHGKTDADRAYAEAVGQAATKFGASIVETRDYQFEAGARRVESGHQQIQTQMPLLTADAPGHDVVFVVDAAEAFGDYLPYRTDDPVPVVGTHGLVSVAWHRAFEQYGSMSLHSAFEKLAHRPITEADYLAWLGVKAFSEAAVRGGDASLPAIRTLFDSDDWVVPGFKGIGLNFRSWNHQLRQPMIIAWHRAMISMSPQQEYLHQRNPLDSIGIDKPESNCKLDEDRP